MIGDLKDFALEVSFEESVVSLKKALLSLETTASSEVSLAIKFADDTHMPHDAMRRLQKALDRVNEKMDAVDEARRALLKYRGVI